MQHFELVALEHGEALLRAEGKVLRLPLGALPGGVEVGDLLRVSSHQGDLGTQSSKLEVELVRGASGRPQTSAVQFSLLYVVLSLVLAVSAQILGSIPLRNLGPQVQPFARYGVTAFLALVTFWIARRVLLDTPPTLEELRNRYGRNDFLLWVLEQRAGTDDDNTVAVFRQRWHYLHPRPARLAFIAVASGILAVGLGLPLVYGLVVITLVCAVAEIVRRRVFAHWSAAHAAEAEALVWSEGFAPYREQLTSTRAQLLEYEQRVERAR